MGVKGHLADPDPRRSFHWETPTPRPASVVPRSESLEAMASGIAHDFNNLLTGILGNAGLAAASLPQSSPARPYLERMEASALLAADLCRQMLAYAGRGPLQLVPCDLGLLVADTLALMEPTLGQNIRVDRDLAGSLPAVLADPGQVRRMVLELVSRAVDAMGAGPGCVQVSTRCRELGGAEGAALAAGVALPPGRYVVLEVADDGAGLGPEDALRLFEPFSSGRLAGQGLGLAALPGLARAHGGGLEVRSAPGEGTRVRLALPVATEDSAAAAGDADWRATGTALVVDDEEGVRAVAGELLQRFGFQVVEARDGLDAVRRFRARDGQFELVLLDLTMPRMDGHAAFREMLKIRPGVAVILMSGFSLQQAAERLGGTRPGAFLQKPFGREALRRALAEIPALRTMAPG